MNKHLVVAALATACWSAALPALEIDPLVPPEINVGGRLIATADFAIDRITAGGDEHHRAINPADSSLLFGFSKYLFNSRDYGFALIGIKAPDADTDLRDDIYLHQLFAGVGGKRYEVKLGRTQLPNTLLTFPTQRDSDLLAYTHVGNPQLNAEAEEYTVYGGRVSGAFWFTPSFSVLAAATARAERDPADPSRVVTDRFNGSTVQLAYDVPEAIKFDRGIRYAALAVDSQTFRALLGEPDGRATAVLAGVSVNLNSNPEASLGLDLQAIASRGETPSALVEPFQQARADSNAVVAALRYRHSPALQTRWQAALTVGWKEFPDFADATSVAVAPSLLVRLGSGVDLIAQYVYERREGALATDTGVRSEQRLALGLSFSLAHTFNESVGERGDILNIEHNLLDFGPAFGGH